MLFRISIQSHVKNLSVNSLVIEGCFGNKNLFNVFKKIMEI